MTQAVGDRPRAVAPAAAIGPDRPAGLVLLVMCAGMFLVLLDVTVVNVAIPTITTGLHTGTAGVQWVVDAYTVALASLLLGGGALADRIGHRGVVLAGLLVFGAASAACALAPSAAVLVAARAAQGVGAALLLPGSIAAIAEAFPGRAEQARALGVWAGVSSLALPAGPLLGGLIVQTLSWRMVFWINPAVVIVCVIGVAVWVRPGQPRVARRLDVTGLGFATVGLAAAVYAVIAAGGNGSRSTVAAVAGVAAAAAVGFVLTERRTAVPLLPLSLLRAPGFGATNTAALVMNLTTNGLLFLITRYLQQILGHDALDAGLMLLPLFIPLAGLSPLAGRFTARRGPRPVMLTGAAFAAAGQLCLLATTPTTGYPWLLPNLLGVGIGVGMFTAPVVAAAVRAVPPERSGLASGVNNTARQTGTALGVATYGAIAGSPSAAHHFVTALRGLGVAAVVLWLIVMALTATKVKPT